MKASIDEFVSIIDRLTTRLDDLEQRVAMLEHPPVSEPGGRSAPDTAGAREQHPLAQVSGSPNIMPVIGRIFLGMAGAYLLRALAESSSMPPVAVAGIALLYAASWVLWAARCAPAAVFASAAYATTAAIILPPMLWELTLRFKVMPAAVAAAALAGFVACAAALAWKSRRVSVVATPTVSASLAAVALMLGTRDPLPFIFALLLIACLTEAAGSTARWPSVRPLVALAVDFAMLALAAIYTSSNGVSPDYQPVSPGILLALFAAAFVIYAGSILAPAVLLRRKIGVFDSGQMLLIFLLASAGILRVTHDRAGAALGVFCLLAGLACYWCALVRFRNPELQRNYHVFSAWAVLLVMAGSLLSFPPFINLFCLGAAAVAATWGAIHLRQFSLAVHGAVYLLVMAVVSGMLQSSIAILLAEPQPIATLVWITWPFTLLCVGLLWRDTGLWMVRQWQQRLLTISLAGLAAWCTFTAAVAGTLLVFPIADAGRLAAMRTLVLSIFAVLLGWSGPRWRRVELVWLAYVFIAVCTLKLLFQDLRTGSAGAIAFSLFCYGLCWMLVPRFGRIRKTA